MLAILSTMALVSHDLVMRLLTYHDYAVRLLSHLPTLW